MNITEATAKACEKPTLVDALSWICVWETDRVVKQYKKNLDEGTVEHCGGTYETCFRYCIQSVMDRYAKQGKWSKETPTEQGWFWYRASNRHHAVATFIEDWGRGVFVAVEIYDNISVDLTEVTVEWWSEKIHQPR